MLVNDILDLLKLFPKEQILIFSQNPPITRNILEPYNLNNSIKVVGGMRTRASNGGLKKIYKATQKLTGIPKGRRCLRAPHQYFDNLCLEKIKPDLLKLKVLILMGGGYFNEQWFRWRRKTLEYTLALATLAHQNGVRVVTLGTTIGPFDSDSDSEFRIFSSAVDLWGVRDKSVSPKILSGLGVHYDKIKYIPDDLMILNRRLLRYEIRGMDEPYAVVECGMVEPKKLKKYLNTHLKIINYLWDKHRIKTLYLPFNGGSDGMWQGTYFKKRLRNKPFFIFRKQTFPVDVSEYIAFIQNAKIVVSTHYHSAVLAVAGRKMPICFVRNVAGSSHYYYIKYMGCLERSLVHSDYPLFSTETSFDVIVSKLDKYVENTSELFDKNYFKIMEKLRMEHLRSLID